MWLLTGCVWVGDSVGEGGDSVVKEGAEIVASRTFFRELVCKQRTEEGSVL